MNEWFVAGNASQHKSSCLQRPHHTCLPCSAAGTSSIPRTANCVGSLKTSWLNLFNPSQPMVIMPGIADVQAINISNGPHVDCQCYFCVVMHFPRRTIHSYQHCLEWQRTPNSSQPCGVADRSVERMSKTQFHLRSTSRRSNMNPQTRTKNT